MAEPFLSLDDTRNRIHRTVCMYKRKPVYVQVQEMNEISVIPLRRDRPEAKFINVADADFSYKSPPLGYMNYQDSVYYVMRIPTRQIRAGLCTETLTSDPRIPADDYIMTKAFEDCIMGKHPTVRDAVKKLQGQKALGVAVHRHLALKLDGSCHPHFAIHYRSSKVGTFDPDRGIFFFEDSPFRSFLERIVFDLHLQEGRIPVDDAS